MEHFSARGGFPNNGDVFEQFQVVCKELDYSEVVLAGGREMLRKLQCANDSLSPQVLNHIHQQTEIRSVPASSSSLI